MSMRRLEAVIVAVVGLLALAWMSAAPAAPYSPDDAVLRLAWRARPERLEVCRPQSEEVLARLPAHMRQAMICEGVTATYRLEVRRDDVVVAEDVVRGGGLRHDRPLYVFREVVMPPGATRLNVRFTRIETPAGRDDGDDDDEDRDDDHDEAANRRRLEGAVPAALEIDRVVRFSPRQVVLVTYDADARALVIADH